MMESGAAGLVWLLAATLAGCAVTPYDRPAPAPPPRHGQKPER